ncbi:hypothetical protein E8E12_009628 [Didymella heteroderae]|uniref:Alcohol dehydrogenase iron-type/glycerol dehydrogenase GldA domain-containing protein n=1 Tax=Didymella heteroderae TaxID=1769908 RepID=A0A9P4WXC5_9PLEO|nr:hypothetical protein E8E12_009628 [Didymella heteroderae]
MNTIRARQLLRVSAPRRNFTQTSRRNLDMEPPAPQPQEPKRPSKVGAFYKTFSAPLLKCFLGALFTYQLAYFGWMKLETIEEAHDKRTEINGLREELAGAINNKRREAEGVFDSVENKVIEGTEGAGAAGKVKKGVAHLDLPGPSVSSGLPYHVACVRHVKQIYNASRVFIIASESLSRNTDKLDLLVDALGTENIVGIQKGMTSHSLWSEILSVTEKARSKQSDCIITLGAGSITDAAKLVVLCLANDIKTPTQLGTYALGAPNPPTTINRPSTPLVCIPTTLSGGEYFALAGGTNDATNQKVGFLHSGMGPDLVILDPHLCLTTPSYHWLSTGVRAVDHCVEALCSLEATSESDERAEHGLRDLAPGLIACREDEEGADVAARKRCQDGVRWAMENVRAGVPMGGSHAIGHQLGPLGVPHGVTSCIMCPAVMKFNVKYGAGNPEIVRRQKAIQSILWSEEQVTEVLKDGGLEAETSDLGDALGVLIQFLKLPRTLGDFQISADKIPALAKNTLEDFWARTNPVSLTETTQVEEILNAVR